MPKGSTYDDLARAAAERLDKAAAVGQQLSLLPEAEPGAEGAADGRAKRGAGKAQSQLRDWLAARGARMPEDVLAQIGGLTGRGDPFLAAMERAEQILAWAGGGSEAKRLAVFQMVYGGMIRANEALLPYGLAKVTPDQGSTTINTFVLPGAAAPAPVDPADQARDVTPKPARIAPPPLPHEMQRNQGLAQPASTAPDAAPRTEGTSR